MTLSELKEGTGLTFFDSILARSLFCSFCGEDRGPRLVAYLEETVHPLPTGEEVAVGLETFFVQFWGSSPFRRGLVPRSPGGRWVGSVFVWASAYCCCLPLLCGLNPVDPKGISCYCQDLGCVFT